MQSCLRQLLGVTDFISLHHYYTEYQDDNTFLSSTLRFQIIIGRNPSSSLRGMFVQTEKKKIIVKHSR